MWPVVMFDWVYRGAPRTVYASGNTVTSMRDAGVEIGVGEGGTYLNSGSGEPPQKVLRTLLNTPCKKVLGS